MLEVWSVLVIEEEVLGNLWVNRPHGLSGGQGAAFNGCCDGSDQIGITSPCSGFEGQQET